MKCAVCGKDFERKAGTRQIYCSRECKNATKRKQVSEWHENERKHRTGICVACGKEYPKVDGSIFCSKECRIAFYGENLEPTERICKVCGKPFKLSTKHRTYCSDECKKLGMNHTIGVARSIAKSKDKTLSDIVSQARAHGMSYGKYVEAKERGIL